MNTRGAVLITDMASGRIWETDAVEPDAVFDEMKSTLPPVVRQTPRQRADNTTERIVKDAIQFYKHNKRWPQSVIDILKEMAIKENDPSLAKDGNIDDFIRQGQALARHIVATGLRQQAIQDSKKVTLDWAGH